MIKSKLRIVQDFVDFNKNRPDGIYLYINQEDIYTNYAMIVGPKNTPYFGGYYLFEIKFPKNYPSTSPQVNFLTIDGKVRFNPNLYECGKVCLSILGTWAGPGWKNVMNLRSVLLSIQSLLHDFPIVNEPGFENYKADHPTSISYNNYLTYFNYKIAIMDVIDSLDKKKPKMPHVNKFKKEIIEELHKNYQILDDNLKSYQLTLGVINLTKFIYFIKLFKGKNTLDFLELNNDFNKIIGKTIKKIEKNEFNII